MFSAIQPQRCLAGFIVAAFMLVCPAFIPLSAAPVDNIWEDEPARQGRTPELTSETIDRLLKKISEKNPQRATQLEQLRKSDPKKFEEQIREEFAKSEFAREPSRPQNVQPGPEGAGQLNRPGGPPGTGPEMSERWREHMQKKHEEYLEWLKKSYPEQAEKLRQLREKNPEQYFQQYLESRKKYDPIIRAESRNPELAAVLKEDLDNQDQSDELLKDIRYADGDKKTKLVEKLTVLMSRRFDLLVKKKQLQYDELRKRLEQMKKELDEQQTELNKLIEKKEENVKSHIKELLGKTEKVRWE